MNEAIKSTNKDESWKVEGYQEDKVCDSGTDPENEGTVFFSPLKCNPKERDWIVNRGSSDEIYKRADLISVTMDEIKKHKAEYSSELEALKSKYYDYLYAYINALDVFGRTINSITINLRQYIGDGSNLFGFINGKFIGTNLKIILKYLKSALGTDIKTVGICLLIVGCALALSISSTILLIIVINVDIKNNQALEYKLNDRGRIIQYQ